MPPTTRGAPEAKRHKPNNTPVHLSSTSTPASTAAVGSALKKKTEPGPVYEKGIEYWDKVDASVDGVLGGFGTGPVPHIEQLSSRLLLLSLLPSLSPFANPLTPTPAPPPAHRRIALDVGAGIGRVTRHVLLPLFDDVILVEPVQKFVGEAHRSATAGEWRNLPRRSNSGSGSASTQPNGNDEGKMEEWKEMNRRVEESNKTRGKRVRFIRGGLQELDPKYPGNGGEELGVVGENRAGAGGLAEEEVEYDVIWCQWCLGHMNHADLVTFLRRAQAALRQPSIDENDENDHQSYIFVKENCCDEGLNGEPVEFLDEEDSSLTRSSGKWLQIFVDAGLEVIREEVQHGMPDELFVVKTWALR